MCNDEDKKACRHAKFSHSSSYIRENANSRRRVVIYPGQPQLTIGLTNQRYDLDYEHRALCVTRIGHEEVKYRYWLFEQKAWLQVEVAGKA